MIHRRGWDGHATASSQRARLRHFPRVKGDDRQARHDQTLFTDASHSQADLFAMDPRGNKRRYCKLLNTRLNDIERDFIQRRLAEELQR
jgi:hypothetical protein